MKSNNYGYKVRKWRLTLLIKVKLTLVFWNASNSASSSARSIISSGVLNKYESWWQTARTKFSLFLNIVKLSFGSKGLGIWTLGLKEHRSFTSFVANERHSDTYTYFYNILCVDQSFWCSWLIRLGSWKPKIRKHMVSYKSIVLVHRPTLFKTLVSTTSSTVSFYSKEPSSSSSPVWIGLEGTSCQHAFENSCTARFTMCEKQLTRNPILIWNKFILLKWLERMPIQLKLFEEDLMVTAISS